MKKENPIESRFKKEELKGVDEIIIRECNDAYSPLKYCGVFTFFDCNNPTVSKYPDPSYCGKCPYIYKLDITRPGRFGCYVRGYIEIVKSQFKQNQKT